MSQRFHKPNWVAKDLRTTEQRLANMRCKKKGPPFVKVESSVLYPVDLYEDYLRERLVETTGAAA